MQQNAHDIHIYSNSSTGLGAETALTDPTALPISEMLVPADEPTVVVAQAPTLEPMALRLTSPRPLHYYYGLSCNQNF